MIYFHKNLNNFHPICLRLWSIFTQNCNKVLFIPKIFNIQLFISINHFLSPCEKKKQIKNLHIHEEFTHENSFSTQKHSNYEKKLNESRATTRTGTVFCARLEYVKHDINEKKK